MAHAPTLQAKLKAAPSQAANSSGTELFVRVGYGAKGVVYLIIGGLAGRVAIGDGGKISDNKGALQAIYQQSFGQILLGVVVAGLVGYALWCFLRAALDMDHRGRDAKGIVARVAYAVVGVLYVAMAYGGLHLLMGAGNAGKSSDASTKDWTATLLNQSYGTAAVVIAGLAVLAVALFLFYYAYSAQFMRMFSGLNRQLRTSIKRLGQIGYAAQAVVFAEIGLFLIVAARHHNAEAARGIGGALLQLTHEPYGHVLLGIVAIGFVAYGIFGLAQARFRSIGNA
jgi:Domain of Unknown Function (DUF1206)